MSTKETNYNIEDYLAWRADVPLSADPFNEVDNMVLCELAYTDFDNILLPDGSRSLAETRDRFFVTHSRDELRRIGTFMTKAPLLMDAMMSGVRFGNITVIDYLDILEADSALQIAAMTFLLDDGTAYVCFRGTDNSFAGWKEDFSFSYMKETSGQKIAVEYLNRIAGRTDRPLRVGGHSKGGNFAVYAASFCDPAVQDRISVVYSNDCPGFQQEVTQRSGYVRMKPKVLSIVPDTSIFGQILHHGYPDVVIKSSETGFMQHDGFSWCVDRNRFIRAERSDLGEFINLTLNDWLSKLDFDVRESFVNTLFGLLDATESDSFLEIKDKKLQSVEAILKSAYNLPRDQKRRLIHVGEELLRSGGDNVREFLPEWFGIDRNGDSEEPSPAKEEDQES